MGFRINTNVAAMNAHNYGVMNNRELDNSLGRLSSGLRINSAADDAAGMAIADSLKSQANSLGQAVKNANDAIGILQTADKAMDEQIKILDTIKTKATQAAADGQSTLSRQAIQNDIVRLMEELDNIATTTSFNGMSLLSGSFINKEFQIGAYSNQTVRASIGSTSSDKIGSTRFETTTTISAANTAALKFSNPDGTYTQIQGVAISHSASTGLGALAEAINRSSDVTGVRASYRVVTTGLNAVKAGDIDNLRINDITIGDVLGVKDSDANGNLINAINAVTHQTGAYASLDVGGRLVLTSTDGRGIKVETGLETGNQANPTMSGLDNVLQIKMFDLQGFEDAPAAPKTSAGFTINGVLVGANTTLTRQGLVDHINSFINQTGVTASLNGNKIVLSGDERGVSLTSAASAGPIAAAVNAATDSTALGMTVGLSNNSIGGGTAGLGAGALSSGFAINGITIGDGVTATSIARINSFTSQTGVTASLDGAGFLVLTSADGRLNIASSNNANALLDGAILRITTPLPTGANATIAGYTAVQDTNQNYGRLTLVAHGSRDIVVSAGTANTSMNSNLNAISHAAIANLRDVRGNFLSETGRAAGAYANRAESGAAVSVMGSGVTTRAGAMMVMDIAESAMKMLDRIRADIGSVQNQIVSTINNISVTKVNVTQAESNIRDVDFAEESANFSKRNLLSQSGSFAMAQANTIQQNVMKLLQ